MRITMLFTVLALALPACVSSHAQIQPALASAAELKRIFDHEQASNLALVRSSNPTPETLASYENVERQVRAAFETTYLAHTALLGSMNGLSAEATATLMQQITTTVGTLLPPKGK